MNISTAEQFLLKQYGYADLKADYPKLDRSIQEVMIEFAKIHVEAALKEAAEKAKIKYDHYDDMAAYVDTYSILTAYPLSNIK